MRRSPKILLLIFLLTLFYILFKYRYVPVEQFAEETCEEEPDTLIGTWHIPPSAPPEEEMLREFSDVEYGGYYSPKTCSARHRLAIIVPYKNRPSQLPLFLYVMHSILRKQQTEYAIYIVEPADGEVFNRAKLLNIGFLEASKDRPWECFVLHDVDLYPENPRHIYQCADQPLHLIGGMNKYKYGLPYADYLGGALAITGEQFWMVNGYSNSFWGWGAEDDEFLCRMKIKGLEMKRASKYLARYEMFKHPDKGDKANPVNPCRYKILDAMYARWESDGLKSMNYTVDDIVRRPLYTHILVRQHDREEMTELESEGLMPCKPPKKKLKHRCLIPKAKKKT